MRLPEARSQSGRPGFQCRLNWQGHPLPNRTQLSGLEALNGIVGSQNDSGSLGAMAPSVILPELGKLLGRKHQYKI